MELLAFIALCYFFPEIMAVVLAIAAVGVVVEYYR